MKKISALFISISVLIPCSFAFTSGKEIKPVDVKTLDGRTVSTSTFSNNGKPMIIVFWISWHKNPEKELDAITENYEAWKKETGVKLIVIAEDDSRTSSTIKGIVASKEWSYEFYIDNTQDFKRAMGVNDVPHTLLVNGDGEVVWEKIGFLQGDENTIHDELIKISN